MIFVQGKRAKEPDVAEFISALAAGNNAQLMVVACANAATSTTLLALVAAAQQTGGRVICILQSIQDLHQSKHALDQNANSIEFVTGNPQTLISTDHYKEADFVLIDCNLENHEAMIRAMQMSTRKGAVVVGYNAFCKGSSWQWSGLKSHLLPIGAGLLVTKVTENKAKINISNGNGGFQRRSHWVVKVDKCTGEEHVFRVRFPQGNYKEIEA